MRGVKGWCILRTAGRLTLPLAESLASRGFDVWTPAEVKLGRARGRRGRAETRKPMMPTFVFARAGHLWSLVSLAEDPACPHEGFSVFRHLDRYPVIADAELEPLRMSEVRAIPLDQLQTFERGERVLVPSGSFCGLGGQVVESNGRFTLVCFGGHMQVKISTFILQPNKAFSGSRPKMGTAAQAA